MKVFCVYSDAQLNGYLAYYEAPLVALGRAGVVVIEERNFLSLAAMDGVDPGRDRVVGFFTTHELSPSIYAAVQPKNRWTFLVDTKVRADGTGAYEARLRWFAELGISGALITYPIPRDVRVLHSAGIRTIVIPCCIDGLRPRVPKTNAVILPRTSDAGFYPTRTRLQQLFRARLPGVSGVPSVGGNSLDPRLMDFKGEDYLRFLDKCEMGVTCRAGIRDYCVGKYVEFGMCHVLPVGDAPSYLPDDMHRAMLDVEGMPDDLIVHEILRLLRTPTELRQRQEAYASACSRHFSYADHAPRALAELSASG